MSNVKKVVVITSIVGVISFMMYGAVKATKSANTADKLDYDINGFTLKEVKKNPLGIPTSLIYTIDLKLNNPTDQDLVISKPYIKVSVKKANGLISKLANTEIPADTETNIRAKSSTDLKHDVEIRILNAAALIPNFLQYIIDRLRGEKATQQVIVDATLDTMGLTIPVQKIVNL